MYTCIIIYIYICMNRILYTGVFPRQIASALGRWDSDYFEIPASQSMAVAMAPRIEVKNLQDLGEKLKDKLQAWMPIVLLMLMRHLIVTYGYCTWMILDEIWKVRRKYMIRISLYIFIWLYIYVIDQRYFSTRSFNSQGFGEALAV